MVRLERVGLLTGFDRSGLVFRRGLFREILRLDMVGFLRGLFRALAFRGLVGFFAAELTVLISSGRAVAGAGTFSSPFQP